MATTNAQNIATIISNLYAYLAQESADPKPSYSIDGQSVSWDQHYASVLAQIDSLNLQLAAAEGPWEANVTGF